MSEFAAVEKCYGSILMGWTRSVAGNLRKTVGSLAPTGSTGTTWPKRQQPRLTCPHPPNGFTDTLSLLKLADGWKIIAKTYQFTPLD
jgi:hypothetical protein